LHNFDLGGGNQREFIDCLQHKGAMSTKPFFEKIAKTRRSYIPLCGHTTFVLLTSALSRTKNDNILHCNDVNKTSTSIELLTVNILCYMSKGINIGLWIKSKAQL